MLLGGRSGAPSRRGGRAASLPIGPGPQGGRIPGVLPYPRAFPSPSCVRPQVEEQSGTQLRRLFLQIWAGLGGGGVGESGVCSEPGGGPGPSFSVFLAWVTYSLPFEEEQVATAGICDWDGTLFQGCGKQLL